MADKFAQKYTITDPQIQASEIDDMFHDLYSRISDSIVGDGIAGVFDDGDLVFADDDEFVGLTIGLSGKVVRSNGTAPTYSTFTISDTFASGSLLHASAADTVSALTIGSAGQVVRSTGTFPAYSTFTIPDTFASGALVYASSTNVLAALAIQIAGRIVRSTGSLPTYSTFTIADSYGPGAILHATSADVVAGLAVGAADTLLRSTGSLPTYTAFTIPNTFAQGDVIFGSASNVLTALAKDASATRYLSNTGATNNPAWAQVVLTNGVTGVLPVANGGTATSTTFTAGSIIFAGASGVYSQDNSNLFYRVSGSGQSQMGIGTTTPVVDNAAFTGLEIYDNTNAILAVTSDGGSTLVFARYSDDTLQGNAFFVKGRGTRAAPTIVQSGDVLGSFFFQGVDKSGGGIGYFGIQGARIDGVCDGTPGLDDMPGRLVFSTTPDGTNAVVERMRISNGGFVGIGQTVPTVKLDILAADNATAVIIGINATQANITGADKYVSFTSTTGEEANVIGTGVLGVIAYNTFTGSHKTRVKKPVKILQLLEMTGTLICKREFTQGCSPKEFLPHTRVCRTKNSKACYGVYAGPDDSGMDMALALGTGWILVANTGKNLRAGDRLMSSDVPGHAELAYIDGHVIASLSQDVNWKKGEKLRKSACRYLMG
jgi:hypothetical protein